MTTKYAALYLRSSKDRSDVSIDAQRRELQALATSKGMLVNREYSDVVESAKDENRPGFQRLLRELKAPDRQWNHLLLVDTSRLSRRRYMAQVFKHEAARRNVEILYSKLPQSDPIADMVTEGVMEVFDELHSLMSKEKGLAGMAENVRQGFRAGGRAPIGYRLKHIPTGAVRDGAPVTKTKLEPSEAAPNIRRYLKDRARGVPRAAAGGGLNMAGSTLVCMEWNALVYAGHTAWNVQNERASAGGYKGGKKRKPRNEWLVTRNTHEALIADDEAETLLTQLEQSSRSGPRRTGSTYLLSGLLKTPQGHSWFGNGRKQYRTKPQNGKHTYIDRMDIERAVLDRVRSDMQSPAFVRRVIREVRKACNVQDPTSTISRKVTSLTSQISSTMDLAARLADPAPAIRKIDELEARRSTLALELDKVSEQVRANSTLQALTEQKLSVALDGLLDDLDAGDSPGLKNMLSSMVDRIELDPQTRTGRIHYRIGVDGRNRLASPGGVEPPSPP